MNALLHERCDDHPDVEPKMNERFQSYYCPTCRTWLSPRCARPYCQHCKGRPSKAPIEDDES